MLLTTIETAAEAMTRAERRVAAHVLAHAEGVLRQPIAALAEAAGVSEPTVIRFCRTMGYQGFQDFKLRLAQDLATGGRSRAQAPTPDDELPEVIGKVMGGAIGTLIRVRDTLAADAVQQAVDLLAAAERIEFYGLGGSGIVAADAQHKFFRLGVPVVAYSDPTVHAVAASLLGPGGVVVAISQSGQTTDMLTSAELGRTGGAAVVAIAPARSALANLAHVCLAIDLRQDEDAFAPIKSRIAHLAVLDVLAVGVALRRGVSFDTAAERSRAR